ncbi:hypothetical protein RRG08_046383 [Elysia crispata]|uniref:Uncharacterized protein n=1 Tax=Elysia crispata TaxID=231223 RepID=A0AAE1ED35_9GAST|nr:hypothetical protein RRG08_046383 [Elysia crispata]
MFPARPAESEKINLEDMNIEKNLTATRPHKARANRLISSNLWRWLADSKASIAVTANSLHPGTVETDLQRHVNTGCHGFLFSGMRRFMIITAVQGRADTKTPRPGSWTIS